MTRHSRNSSVHGFMPVLLSLVIAISSTVIAQEPPVTTTPPTAENEAESVNGDEPASESTSQNAVAEKPTEAEAPEKEDPLPFNVRPYKVIVTVGFEYDCLTSSSVRSKIIVEIEEAVERMYGRMWDPVVEESLWLAPGNRQTLAGLDYEDLAERYPEQEVDKAFTITIQNAGNGLEICCRECDPRIHEMTPIYSETIFDSSTIGSTTARLLRDTFRPCAMFERNIPGEAGRMSMVLQMQAGEILPPDPSAVQVVEGDVLRPFIRQMERRSPTKLQKLQAINLTYLKVLEIDREVSRGLITAFYLTHLNPALSPFGGKGKSQQHFAVRQRRTADESRVRLVLNSRADKPLVSHRLALAYQLHYKDEEDPNLPQVQLVSDRNGEVTIPVQEGHPTFWIRVYSGTSLLARVPYAPGLKPFDTIELPDDSVRLSVEGEIQLLSDDLIDAIALRGVLLARARKEADAGNTDAVKELFERYDSVPARDSFLERISNIRILAMDDAKKKRVGTRGIETLCDGLQATVSSFFSDAKRAERTEEIQKIKQLAEQKAN